MCHVLNRRLLIARTIINVETVILFCCCYLKPLPTWWHVHNKYNVHHIYNTYTYLLHYAEWNKWTNDQVCIDWAQTHPMYYIHVDNCCFHHTALKCIEICDYIMTIDCDNHLTKMIKIVQTLQHTRTTTASSFIMLIVNYIIQISSHNHWRARYL